MLQYSHFEPVGKRSGSGYALRTTSLSGCTFHGSKAGASRWMPDVWVSRWRMVMPLHDGGVPSRYLLTGSSTRSFPSWTSSMIPVAMNCLLIDPIL